MMQEVRYLLLTVALLFGGWFAPLQQVSAADDSIALGANASAAKARGEGCVEPTEVMRSQHMEFLLHHRDETVLFGVRTKKHSLKNCIACHVSEDEGGNYLRINAEGQFCQGCHEQAAVHLDCFQCHATTPRKK